MIRAFILLAAAQAITPAPSPTPPATVRVALTTPQGTRTGEVTNQATPDPGRT